MEQAANLRKYVILQERDTGFGVQRPPEGFARLDANREGLTVSLQVKNLREGALPYTVILVYGQNDDVGVIRAGNLEIKAQTGFFSRRLEADVLQRMNMQPANLRYVLIAAEHPERTNIPMVGICSRAHPWSETIRARLRREKTPQTHEEAPINTTPAASNDTIARQESFQETNSPANTAISNEAPSNLFQDTKGFSDIIKNFLSEYMGSEKKASEPSQNTVEKAPEVKAKKSHPPAEEKPVQKYLVDDARLERKLKESFDTMEPFFNPRHDYAWYRVNDLARLSNLLFACNLRIPLFANPKILVGLFKYRHLLAGFYRSERNDLKYFVLGVPSRDDLEGRPFESISRWVEVQNPDYGDMSGYWLVYINLQNGEFVQ